MLTPGLGTFLLQTITLTTAPVFFCAGIYLCLGRVVHIYSTSLSRFNPKWYTWDFLSCDMISLSLQGAGGALSAAAATNQESQASIAVMLSGLSFQRWDSPQPQFSFVPSTALSNFPVGGLDHFRRSKLHFSSSKGCKYSNPVAHHNLSFD